MSWHILGLKPSKWLLLAANSPYLHRVHRSPNTPAAAWHSPLGFDTGNPEDFGLFAFTSGFPAWGLLSWGFQPDETPKIWSQETGVWV